MRFSFNPKEGPILILTKIWGPEGDTVVHLALDTGATTTVINWDILILLGYDVAVVPDRRKLVTASGIEFAPQISIDKMSALGEEQKKFPLICHTLPASSGVNGLLGLDFFRGKQLVIDFRIGKIDVQ